MNALKRHPNLVALLAIAVIGGFAVQGRPAAVDSAIVTGIYALIALSAGLIYGQTGLLSIAQGIFAAIGAYVTAIATTRLGIPPSLSLVLSLAAPALLALCMSPIVNRLGPLAVALGTLAFAKLAEMVIRSWDSVTGGYVGMSGIPPLAGFDQPISYAALVWSVLAVAVWAYENLMSSMYGQALSTIRHDRARASADGVAVGPLLSTTYAISAAFAGAAGWLYAHHVGYLDPHSLDSNVSINVMLMAVVGGVGVVVGPVVGAIVLSLLLQFLPAQEVQGVYFGAALMLMLVLAPDGLLGSSPARRLAKAVVRAPSKARPIVRPVVKEGKS